VAPVMTMLMKRGSPHGFVALLSPLTLLRVHALA
jgi:hypothetical protein